MRHQVSLTQWCGITSQKTRILNYTGMKSSELKELIFLPYSKQCVTVWSRVLLDKLILVQLAILSPREVAPCMVGMCWSRFFHLCVLMYFVLTPRTYIPTSPKCVWLANRVIAGNICVNRMARQLDTNEWKETRQVVRGSYGNGPRDHWYALYESLVRLLIVYPWQSTDILLKSFFLCWIITKILLKRSPVSECHRISRHVRL